MRASNKIFYSIIYKNMEIKPFNKESIKVLTNGKRFVSYLKKICKEGDGKGVPAE